MKYGIAYGYFSKDWEGEYAPMLERAARCGFDVLEIFTPRLLMLSETQLAELRAEADGCGMELAFLAGLGREHDLSSRDPSVRRAGIEYVTGILKVIHRLGGRVFSGINFCAWADVDGIADKPARRDDSIASLQLLARVAEDCGISYNLEITNRFENFLLNTAQEAVEFVEQVGSPNVNILLDTFHMNIEEDSIYDAIVLAGERLGHFHAGENNRRNPGRGMVRWDQVGAGLKKIGYDKIVTLEPLVLTGGTVSGGAKIFRDMADGGDDETMDANARSGLAFMKQLLN